MGLTKPRAYQIFDIDYKQAVRVILLTNVTLAGGAPSSVDGVNLSVGDRILVAGQSTGSQNGVYQVSVLGTGSNGTWIRSVDTNESGELNAGTIVMVTEGVTYKDTQWKLTTNDPIVIGTTALVFEQNSAFAFGNIYANSTAVLADIVGDTVTFVPANNMVILANATSDTINFEVSQSPNFTGNFVVSGTVGSNLIPTANITYNLGNTTNRWNDIWLANSTIYLGNARISANATAVTITNPAGGTTVLSGATPALSASTLTVTGNVTGGNIVTAGQANIGTLTVNGGSTFTGNLLPSANVTYNLGSPTQRWNEIFLAGNTIDIGGATISADLVTGSLILTGPDGAEFILTGSDAQDALGAFGFLSAGNSEPSISTTTGALTVAGGAGIAGNLHVGDILKATGNVEGGNLITAGQVTATGNITGGNLTVSGQTTVTGNVSGSNISTTGQITATGNISGSNISGTNLTGTLITAAQPNVTSVGTLTSLNVSGNIDSGNASGTRAVFNTISGTLETAAQPNISSLGTLSALSIAGNLSVAGNVSITGNVNYANVTDLVVGDPLIFLGANNTSNVVDLGFIVTYDDGVDQHGGWVRDASDGTWKLFGNVVPEPTTTVNFTNAIYQPMLSGAITSIGAVSAAGNIVGANITSNAQISAVSLSVIGNANVGNLGGTSAVFTNLSGTLITAAQPNITSVGSLSSLTVTGNANAGNVGGTRAVFTNVAGTLETAAQPNITSLGTLTNLTVSGNIAGGNLTTGAQVVATGNVTGGNIVTAGQVVATGNIHGALVKSSANIEIQNRGILYLNDSDNSNYVGLRSPASLTGNYIYIFPSNYGNAAQVLSTNGAGGLSWVDQSGGGGGSSATSYPNSTVSPVPGATGNFDLSYNFVQTSQETPFETSATDAFGVNLGEVYSMMDPGGEVLDPVDLGVLT